MYSPEDPPNKWASGVCTIPLGMGDGKSYRNEFYRPETLIVIPSANVHDTAKALCNARLMSQDCDGDWPSRQTTVCPSKDNITRYGFPIVWSGEWAYDYSEENSVGPKINDNQRWEKGEKQTAIPFDEAWKKGIKEHIQLRPPVRWTSKRKTGKHH